MQHGGEGALLRYREKPREARVNAGEMFVMVTLRGGIAKST